MRVKIARAIESISIARWFSEERARAYVIILAAITGLIATVYVALSSGVNDPFGKALGTDFASFWTASRLALDGEPSAAWDVARHQAMQAAMFGPDAGYAAFFYPPTYLLICLPLAAAPYAVSLTIWLATTLTFWAQTIRAWAGNNLRWTPILAFPAVLVNAGHGQNGFLTAALFGTAALISVRRPWLSGALFGTLIIKPHLALLVPIFFMLSGNWRGFVAAGATAAGLCFASLIILGPDAWRGFLDTSDLARAALEQDLVGYARMQSAYAGARLIGAPNAVAWGVQGMFAAGAIALLWRTRAADEGARGATLCCATVMATPFLLDYDLTLLAIPMAWLFRDILKAGLRDWDKLVLSAGYILPLIARPVGAVFGVPLTSAFVVVIALCILRRSVDQRAVTGPPLSVLSMSRSQ